MVYLLTGALALACVMVAESARPDRQNLLWALAFLALWLPAALRVDVGVDYSRYQGYRELYRIYALGGELPQGMDVGFVALVRLLAAVGADAQWLFVVTSALVVGLTLRACHRLSDEPAMSVALFLVAGLYLESLNIVRQWIAIACVLNALGWVADDGPCGRRSLPRYCAWVLAGSLFHETCLVWLALWPVFALLRRRMTGRRALVLLASLVLGALVLGELAPKLLEGTRFGRYLVPGSGDRAVPEARLDTIGTGVVMFAFVLWAQCRSRHQSRRHDTYICVASDGVLAEKCRAIDDVRAWRTGLPMGEWDACLLVCQVVGVALALSGAFLPSIVDRVTRYFVPLLILQLPRAVAIVDDEDLRDAICLAILACWIVVTFVRVWYGGQYGVLPYRCLLF